ncbi:SEC-C metal-binding domain-containing protein [Streptomyces sp. NPDC004787]
MKRFRVPRLATDPCPCGSGHP